MLKIVQGIVQVRKVVKPMRIKEKKSFQSLKVAGSFFQSLILEIGKSKVSPSGMGGSTVRSGSVGVMLEALADAFRFWMKMGEQ